MMAALIKDPVVLLAYLAGVVGLVFQVSRLPRLQGLFDRLPALVWTYFIPMLSTSAGIIPDADVSGLKAAGVRHIFGPGTPMAGIVDFLKGLRP